MNRSKDTSDEKQLRRSSSPGVIYFIAAGSPAAAIKIGATARATLLDRLKKIQMHNHEPIELLGVIRFSESDFPTRDAEDHVDVLLNQFAHLCRFKPHTRGAEWFNPSPELLKLIEETSITPEILGFPRFVCTPIGEDVQPPAVTAGI